MTEWIVDNIAEAFEKKNFPLFKEIFDLFTRVFVQSKQVGAPMDILRMALYERVQEGKIERKIQKNTTAVESPLTLPTTTTPLPNPEHELPPPSHVIPETEKTLPLPEKQLPIPSHEITSGSSE